MSAEKVGTKAQENVKTVERAVSALNARDIESYLDCCTDDIELHITSMEAIGGEYVGRDAIRRFWTDIADTSPDFSVEVERAESIADDGVIAFMLVNATGRASGIAVMDDVRTVNLYDFRHGRISRVRAFNDRAEGLAAAGLPEDEAG
jgi:ketosteroid isomerase-like protein